MSLRLLSRPWLAPVTCGLVLAALAAWDRALIGRDDQSRAGNLRVGHPLPEGAKKGKAVAAVRIVHGGHTVVYGHQRGAWRCLSFQNAPAITGQMEILIGRLTDAAGMVVNAEAARPGDYGFDAASTSRVTLHGSHVDARDASVDVIAAFDLGTAFTAGTGAFVRRVGERAIWAVDQAAREVLGDTSLRPAPGMERPPLLDPAVVPEFWRRGAGGVSRIHVEPVTGSPFDLIATPVVLTPEEVVRRQSPVTWSIAPDGGPETRPAMTARAEAMQAFLWQVPWSELRAAKSADATAPRRARVVVTPLKGEDLVLTLTGADTSDTVLVSASQLLVRIVRADVARMFPPLAALMAGPEPGLWPSVAAPPPPGPTMPFPLPTESRTGK